jgi:exonuclease VII small subunit
MTYIFTFTIKTKDEKSIKELDEVVANIKSGQLQIEMNDEYDGKAKVTATANKILNH